MIVGEIYNFWIGKYLRLPKDICNSLRLSLHSRNLYFHYFWDCVAKSPLLRNVFGSYWIYWVSGTEFLEIIAYSLKKYFGIYWFSNISLEWH